MVMGTARYVNSLALNELPSIVVNNTNIPFVDSVGYLGFTITNNLSWENQITKTTSKIFASLHQLKLCKSLLPISLRERLVKTLIFPILDYCSAALTDITREQNLRLQRALNACVRFIYQARRDEHITPYFERLGWLKAFSRRNYLVGSLAFCILRTKKPAVIHKGYVHRSDVTSRDTRAPSDTLSLPQCRTELFRRSFRCASIELWNGFPLNIRNAKSLDVFKSGLYDFLLSANR
ncbi:uncharacterized protein LOC113004687 [Solenopsis invicta]|uniref:uncharacterized protein LOC113004687 n=1 Tax=Solenopsis invicta TaxID=13686 RepID=UPI000E33D82C|nr:uncharacterized protein LOC113004687 [Solenopsis invicta]